MGNSVLCGAVGSAILKASGHHHSYTMNEIAEAEALGGTAVALVVILLFVLGRKTPRHYVTEHYYEDVSERILLFFVAL